MIEKKKKWESSFVLNSEKKNIQIAKRTHNFHKIVFLNF